MARNNAPNLLAGGNIYPARFVKLDTSADNQCLVCGANERAIGISQVGTDDPPGLTGASTYAAQAGENIEVFSLGDVCLLYAGSGGWTRGDHLKSDASGGGVAIATTGVQQNVGAYALESAAAGEYGRVQVVLLNELVPSSTGAGVFTDITGTDASLGIAGIAGSSGAGGIVAIVGGAGDTDTAGGLVSNTGGAGNGTGAGGLSRVVGGAGGATGAGGAAKLTGGAGGATSGTGGASDVLGGAGTNGNAVGGRASLISGAGNGSGAGGVVTITSGAAGATGVAGAVNISVGGATAGNGSAVTITGGAGAGGTASGGHVNLVGGAAVSTGAPGEVQINGNAAIEVITLNYVAALVTQTIFTATRAVRVKAIIGRTRVAGSGGACTLSFFKCATTVAVGSGTLLHTGSFNVAATADGNQDLTLSTTVADVTLAAGDSIGYVLTGTATSAVGNVAVHVVPV